ncbi:hypothetical protein GGI35DRAFT_459740 [Trichoderma velutinum]
MIQPEIHHPRFLGAEPRLSRYTLDKAVPRSEALVGGRHDYSSFSRDNLAWIAAVSAYMVLILTVMQVGAATSSTRTTLSFNRHNMSSHCLHLGACRHS